MPAPIHQFLLTVDDGTAYAVCVPPFGDVVIKKANSPWLPALHVVATAAVAYAAFDTVGACTFSFDQLDVPTLFRKFTLSKKQPSEFLPPRAGR